MFCVCVCGGEQDLKKKMIKNCYFWNEGKLFTQEKKKKLSQEVFCLIRI